MTGQSTNPITRLVLARRGTALRLEYADGTNHELPAILLRGYSPSAETGGWQVPDEKLANLALEVHVLRVEPVGNYAIRLVFDDGHDTGLYTLDHLEQLARRADECMARIETARSHG